MRNTPAKPPLSGRRVLLVEDEPEVAEAVERMLEEAGATIIGPAGTVIEALGLLAHGRLPDVAVLDLNLHGEISLPVADALAGLGMPFVVTTGYGAMGDLARHQSAPVLSKPYGAAELVEQLRQLCGPVC